MKLNLIRQKIGALLLFLLLLGCNDVTRGVGGTETGTTTPAASTISAALKLATETSAPALIFESKDSVGQVSKTGLTSLKYYITSITICEDMKISGSGFSNTTGCLELYSGNQKDDRYTYQLDQDFAPFADVARQSDDGFVDLMDDTTRAKLNSKKTLTESDVRSYHYGYINWYLPIKITAEVDMGNGTIFRTNDGTTVTVDKGVGPITTSTKNFTDVLKAEEAVVVHGNGGSWFRFQNPFVISKEDITNKTEFSLDLTFNPDGLVKGYSADISGCGSCTLKDPLGNQFLVPFLDLTPVPHKTSEKVLKETYLSTVQSGTDNFDIRIELYSVKDDSAKTIYGVDAATLINNKTTTAVSPFSKVSFIKTENDGTLEFQDYQGDTGVLISGFKRQTTEGSSFQATLHCGNPAEGGFMVNGCGAGEIKEITFILQSLTTLK